MTEKQPFFSTEVAAYFFFILAEATPHHHVFFFLVNMDQNCHVILVNGSTVLLHQHYVQI